MNPEGVISRKSPYAVKETIDRLQEFLMQHGATIYARINQQNEVNNVGINLAPLEFLLFGNPKTGGGLMSENPLIALDLPLKIIAYEDDEGSVWIAYNKASYIEERYSFLPAEKSPLELGNIVDTIVRQ